MVNRSVIAGLLLIVFFSSFGNADNSEKTEQGIIDQNPFSENGFVRNEIKEQFLKVSMPDKAACPAIPQKEAASTEALMLKKWHEWMLKNLEEDYRSHRKDSQFEDQILEVFREMSVHCSTSIDFDSEVDNLLPKCKELIDAGCQYPYVLYVYGNLLHKRERLEEAAKYVEDALAIFREEEYPKYYYAQALKRLIRIYKAQGQNQKKTYDMDLQLGQVMGEALVDKWYRNEPYFYLRDLNYITDDTSIQQMRLLHNTANQLQDADPYSQKVIEGLYLIREVAEGWQDQGAWAIRSDTKKWPERQQFLENAKKSLLEAYEMRPDLPFAPADMITVRMGLGNDNLREWFDKSVSAQFDYPEAYLNYRSALRTHWGGTHYQLYDFGLECLKTARFDTMVPRSYIDFVFAIAADSGNPKEVFSNPIVLANGLACCKGYINSAKPDDKNIIIFFKTVKACFLFLKKDYADAKKTLDELGGRINYDMVEKMGLSRDFFPSIVEVYARGLGEKFDNAEKMYSSGQSPEAISLYEELAKEMAGNPSFIKLVEERLSELRIANKFNSGEWTNLIPENNSLGAWSIQSGKWYMEKETLTGIACPNGAKIFCRPFFGRNFELKGEVTAKGKAEIIFGFIDFKNSHWFSITINPGEGTIDIAMDSNREKVLRNFRFPTDTNTFHMAVWNKKLYLLVNGVLVFTDQDIPNHWADLSKSHLGLGFSWRNKPSYKLEYKNIEVRKLTSKPEFPSYTKPVICMWDASRTEPDEIKFSLNVANKSLEKQKYEICFSTAGGNPIISPSQTTIEVDPATDAAESFTLKWDKAEESKIAAKAQLKDVSGKIVAECEIKPNVIDIPQVSGLKYDGNLDDWPEDARIPKWFFLPGNGSDPQFRLYLGYSKLGISYGLEVKGSDCNVKDPRKFRESDCLEFFIDTKNDKDPREYKNTDHDFWLSPLPDNKKVFLGRNKKFAEIPESLYDIRGSENICIKNNGTYVMEGFLGCELMNGLSSSKYTAIGMFIDILSFKNGTRSEFYWPPRDGNPENTMKKPDMWGVVRFK